MMHSGPPPDGGSPSADDESDPPEWKTRRAPRAPTKHYARPMVVADTSTDAKNGLLFAEHHAGHLQYVADTQKWITWNSQRWIDAVEGDLLRAAKETAIGMFEHGAKIANEAQRMKETSWALASLNMKRITPMIRLASSEKKIEIRAAQLDRDPLLLNVQNGTVNLRDGLLRPHSRSDFITKIVPVSYDIAANCPRWLTFLDEVFGKDAELIAFVQRAIGYSLTGDTREHCLFLLWGNGCNGKSVFIEMVRTLLGDFAIASPMSTFTAKRDNGGPTNDLAMLRGARLVTVQESEQGSRFSESTVKSLTGGDAITARFLNREFFTFVPAFKPWIATNHKPRVKGTDDGFWRRVRLIPFTVSFLGREDKGLLAALQAELPGILNWAIDGCIEWQVKGLGTAGAVVAATQSYREESDSIAAFITDCLIMKQDAWISSKRAHALHAAWCDENGERPCTKKALTQALLTRPGIYAAMNSDHTQRGLRGVGELVER